MKARQALYNIHMVFWRWRDSRITTEEAIGTIAKMVKEVEDEQKAGTCQEESSRCLR